MSKRILLTVAAAAMMFAAAPQAFADWNDHGNNNGNWHNNAPQQHYRAQYQRGRPIIVQQRPVYYYYPQQAYGYSQPVYVRPVHYIGPRYVVGQRLVTYQAVPQPILYQLQPCPQGYFYSYQDNNVFLVRQHDNVIAQVISLLLQ